MDSTTLSENYSDDDYVSDNSTQTILFSTNNVIISALLLSVACFLGFIFFSFMKFTQKNSNGHEKLKSEKKTVKTSTGKVSIPIKILKSEDYRNKVPKTETISLSKTQKLALEMNKKRDNAKMGKITESLSSQDQSLESEKRRKIETLQPKELPSLVTEKLNSDPFDIVSASESNKNAERRTYRK